MRYFGVLLLLLCFTIPIFAQEAFPDQIVATGMALNQYSRPQIQGWATYGRKIRSGLYSLSTYDITAIPGTEKTTLGILPQLKYSARTGLAVHVYAFSERISLWGLGDLGLASTGADTGTSFSGGSFGLIRFAKGWGGILMMRVIHDPVAGTQYVPAFGFVYGGK